MIKLDKPSNISSNKDNTNTHDDKERLKSRVMFEAGNSHALTQAIVLGSASLTKEVGMVCSPQQFCQKHCQRSEIQQRCRCVANGGVETMKSLSFVHT